MRRATLYGRSIVGSFELAADTSGKVLEVCPPCPRKTIGSECGRSTQSSTPYRITTDERRTKAGVQAIATSAADRQATRNAAPAQVLAEQVRRARGRASGAPGDARDGSTSRRTRRARAFGARR